MPRIDDFRGAYAFLSNFYLTPAAYEGTYYKTAEHTYQAAKTRNPEDKKNIEAAPSPGIAKRMGKAVALRKDWESIKDQVMLDILRSKFFRRSLRKQLLNTGDAELVEVNSWGDTYWGVCKGKGENRLGKLLMQVRDEYRQEAQQVALGFR